MITIKEALSLAGQRIKEAGGSTPSLDAAVLLGFVVGCDRAGLYRDWQRALKPDEESLLANLVARREAGEPVAYITGRKEFMGLEFKASPAALIPRPETELLVEKAISLLKERESIIIDVGTGAGAIAVSLAVNLPRAVLYATDVSPRALQLARVNALKHGVDRRVFFRQGDLLAALSEDRLIGRIDLIAANLPYITTEEMADLPPEVRRYEPLTALDGGADGLALYRRLIPEATLLLKPQGYLLLEIGCSQREGIAALLRPPDWRLCVGQDLAGWDRLAIATKANPASH